MAICCFVEILTLKEVFQIASNGKCKILNITDITRQQCSCRLFTQKTMTVFARLKVTN